MEEEVRTFWQPINEYPGDVRLRFMVQPNLSTRYYLWGRVGIPAVFNPTSIKWPKKEEK